MISILYQDFLWFYPRLVKLIMQDTLRFWIMQSTEQFCAAIKGYVPDSIEVQDLFTVQNSCNDRGTADQALFSLEIKKSENTEDTAYKSTQAHIHGIYNYGI